MRILILFSLVLYCCLPSFAEVDSSSSKRQSAEILETLSNSLVQKEAKIGCFKISVPKEWKFEESQPPTVLNSRDLTLPILLMCSIQKVKPGTDLLEYANSRIDNYKNAKDIEQYICGKVTFLSLDGVKAAKVTDSFLYPSINAKPKHLNMHVILNDCAFTFTIYCPEANFDECLPLFEKILDSVRFLAN